MASAKKATKSKTRAPAKKSARKARPSRKPTARLSEKASASATAPGRGATAASSSTKQDQVLAMLRSPAGATIEAIMGATGWQAHSVRGFFAGTVRKKLKLELTSAKVDGKRIYRVAKDARAQ